MSIGKNIAKYRKLKGMTQEDLGIRLGVTNQAVSKWESEVYCPDIMLLPEIAKALGVSMDDLYDDSNAEIKAVPPSETLNDNSVLVISVTRKGKNIKVRVPIAAAKAESGMLKKFISEDEYKDLLEALAIMPENGILSDIEANGSHIVISVEKYEDNNQ